MTIKTIYTTGSRHKEIHTFANQEEVSDWDATVLALKAESSAVYQRKLSVGSINDEVRLLYDDWMQKVKAFRDKFGEDRVPADIKWALNTAEEGLEIEVTQWTNPPNRSLFE